jgi:hypothetical protein
VAPTLPLALTLKSGQECPRHTFYSLRGTIMSGDTLIEQFEAGTTAADTFHHADHVRLAFEYLCRYPVLEALPRFSGALRRFAAAQGKAQRYHETITWAYMFLVRETLNKPMFFVRLVFSQPLPAFGVDSSRSPTRFGTCLRSTFLRGGA